MPAMTVISSSAFGRHAQRDSTVPIRVTVRIEQDRPPHRRPKILHETVNFSAQWQGVALRLPRRMHHCDASIEACVNVGYPAGLDVLRLPRKLLSFIGMVAEP